MVRIMKLIAILLTVAFLQVRADGFTQATVTFSGKDVALEKVISAIKQQTGYTFFYTMDIWKEAKPVTINVKNATVVQVLNLVMEQQPFSYLIEDKTIIISKKKEQQLAAAQKSNEAPPIDVKGRVVNESGEPVQATITVKGTSKGTSTNQNGEFQLSGLDENAVLVITGVGIEERELKVGGKSNLSVVVKIGVKALDEVQMIAYGSTTKRFNTGNVSTVKATDIARQPVTNPMLALQGRVAGMEITQSTGLPGTAITVRIRGQNSILSGNDPLYVIDGVPYNGQLLSSVGLSIVGQSGSSAGSPFSYINPSDIESIDVLKDADATAIYGSRGANGVVLITTKKGKAGKLKVDFNVQTGIGNLTKKLDLLNTSQYLEMRNEGLKNDNRTVLPSDYDLALWDTTRNTDWQKVLLGGTAHYLDIQNTLTGGNENTQFIIGTGYHKETTVFPGDLDDNKGFAHFNINSTSMNHKFHVQFSGSFMVDNNSLQAADLTQMALTLPPDAPPVYKDDGTLNWAPDLVSGFSSWNAALTTWTNPATYQLSLYENKTYNIISNAIVSYQILKGLDIKSSFGYTNLHSKEIRTNPLISYDPARWSTTQRNSTFYNTDVNSWIIEPQITYTKDLTKNRINLVLGSSIQQSLSLGEGFNAMGFINDILLKDIASASTITAIPTINNKYKYNAFFARINYNYDDKYLLNVTGRRDGTSRFISDKRFHNFGAVGAAWIFSKEKFLNNTRGVLSYGKLRASYGVTGSDQIGDYAFMDLYRSLTQGVPYQGAVVIQPNSIYTPELEWEETKKMELGLELGFLNDKILLSTSYYRNRSSSQLFTYQLPAITGFTSVKRNLPALVENKGLEFELRTTNISKINFRWNSSVNLTLNRNKLVAGAQGLSDFYISLIGHPLNSTYVYSFLGVDPTTGLYQIADQHGSPTTSPSASDKNVLIDLTPRFYGGFQNAITYRGLQLDFLFQFVKQKGPGYLYNGLVGRFSSGNQPTNVLNRWQSPGDDKPIQKFGQNADVNLASLLARSSEQLYIDASYIRLKNISLSWNLPNNWQRFMRLQSARFYMLGQNIFTITKYKGLDPEMRRSTNLPALRVITLGVQVSL
jgi:TonB-linked SusC/RagA family outer membrane protein